MDPSPGWGLGYPTPIPAGQDGVTTGVNPVATAGVKGYVVPDGITTLSVPAGGPKAFGEVEVVGLGIKRIGFYLFLFSIHWVSSYHLVVSHNKNH